MSPVAGLRATARPCALVSSRLSATTLPPRSPAACRAGLPITRMSSSARDGEAASSQGSGGGERGVLPRDVARAPGFHVRKEEVAYKRYLTVYNREIEFPQRKGQERVYDFDVVGHPRSSFHFTVTFPFEKGGPGGGYVTLVKEYAQGLDSMVLSLPTGGYDKAKHGSLEECARAELSEEAHLCGGHFVRLIDDDHPGFAEVKWCRNRFTPFVVVDPEADAAPMGRDEEEADMEIVRVGLDELRAIVRGGEMGLPSMTTCHLALEYLREHGHLP